MEKNKRMRISVAICTYNGEKYIREQLESILNQEYSVDEIVVGDDGSSDRTIEVAEKILKTSDVSYLILRSTTNIGYRKNFERTIAATKGEIIFLSDQDDVWKRNKVKVVAECFQKNPRYLMAFSDADVVDIKLNKQKRSLWEACFFKRDKKKIPEWDLLFLKGWYVTGAAAAIRRQLFEQVRPFSEICVHDAWLAMAAGLQDRLLAIPDKLWMYRQHGANQIGVAYSFRNKLRKKKEILVNLFQNQMIEHRNKKLIYIEMKERFDFFICDKPGFEKQMDKCIEFHSELAGMKSMPWSRRMRTILKHVKNGNYTRFTTTKGWLAGDFLFALLYKREKLKVKSRIGR